MTFIKNIQGTRIQGSISGLTSVQATEFYGDGSNLTGISTIGTDTNSFVTGGTISSGGSITLGRNDGGVVNILNTGGGNSIVDSFYYQVSNSVDTRPVFTDGNVTVGWDETGNDLEFTMDTAPGGTGDMRSLSYRVGGGSTQNKFITTVGSRYDLYGAGVYAGNRVEIFVTAENDDTYPAYKITVYNTGESSLVSIWIERITKN
jgi:hypothetical protein